MCDMHRVRCMFISESGFQISNQQHNTYIDTSVTWCQCAIGARSFYSIFDSEGVIINNKRYDTFHESIHRFRVIFK